MVKKSIVIVIILLFVTITGSSDPDIVQFHFTYTGENDSWSVVYKVDIVGWFAKHSDTLGYESKGGSVLTVTYKKDISILSSVKHFGLTYALDNSTGEMSEDSDTGGLMQKTYKIKDDNGGYFRANPAYEVAINLDGNVQSITLTSNPLYNFILF